MIQKCKSCQQEYDITKQSSLCPHKLHFKMCKKHSRVLCGMPECNKEQGVDNANSDRGINPVNTISYHQSSVRS